MRDLETTCGLITYNNEELEVKNETLEKDISSLDDKIEEAYGESRKLKEVIGNTRTEHDKLVETLSEKEDNIVNLKEELYKMKNSFQKHKSIDNEKDATILMMENVLETRDQQIYRLEKDIQLAKETTTL